MKARILVVDDDDAVRNVLKRFLTRQGHIVTTANNGKEALEKIQTDQPQLILLDMRMPVLDGIKTLRKLRESHPEVAVMMVTANDDMDLAKETLALGASDYITKPFDLEYLETTVMTKLATMIS